MTDDGIDFNPRNGEDFIPGVPKPRKPERAGKPRAAREDDLKAAMDRIIADIQARDTGRDGKLRWR